MIMKEKLNVVKWNPDLDNLPFLGDHKWIKFWSHIVACEQHCMT